MLQPTRLTVLTTLLETGLVPLFFHPIRIKLRLCSFRLSKSPLEIAAGSSLQTLGW